MVSVTNGAASTAAGQPGPAGRGTFLIGYDVESGNPDVTRPFLRRVQQIHEETGVPATFFLCGRTVEKNVDALRPLAADPLFDFQQHTYNHVLLKTVCIEDPQEGMRFFRGGTLDQIRDEVQRTSDLLFSVDKVVSYVSQFVTLLPGDLIYTGTPGSTKAMKPGDVVEVEIEGVGVLRNKVAGPRSGN